MSLGYESYETGRSPDETTVETHELVAWFADPEKRVNEQMPPLSELSLRRLNGLIGDDQAFDFMSTVANLYDIKDVEQQQAVYLYMCGYSEQDLELMSPDFPPAKLATIVDGWQPFDQKVQAVEARPKYEKHRVNGKAVAWGIAEDREVATRLPSAIANLFSDILDGDQQSLLAGFTDAQIDLMALEMGKIYNEHASSKKLVNRYVSHMRRLMRGVPASSIAREDGLSIGTVYNAFAYKLPKLYNPHKDRIVREFQRVSALPSDTEGPNDNELLFDTSLDRQIGRRAVAAEVRVGERKSNEIAVSSLPKEDIVTDMDLVRVYLNGIGKVALLSAADEVELAKRIEAGLYAGKIISVSESGKKEGAVRPKKLDTTELRDLQYVARDGEKARNHLLEANLRLVVSLAKRYTGRGMPLLDLIQEGNLGLIRAVEKFDYTKGFKFSTYATWWIRQAITRGMADQNHTIRIPVHVVEQVNKLARIKRELHQDLGREATREELAEESGIDIDKVDELLEYGREPVSLDMPVGEDDEAPLGDFINDTQAPAVVDVIMATELTEHIQDVVASLGAKEQKVIKLRFGLDDGNPQTLDRIGRSMNLSRERVRQIENEVIAKLRNGRYADQLRGFADY